MSENQYEQISANVKVNQLGHLITAITLVTEQQNSKEYAELQENSTELENLKEFMELLLQNDDCALALSACTNNDILNFIQKNQEHLKTVVISVYMPALQAILAGKDQEFPENPGSFAEHPIAFYAQLLNDFVETRFFALNEESGTTITHAFNYCCQKLYTACTNLEEQVTKKLITSVVDCMWLFTLLEKNKNEVIYVLGGWRYANLMVILEELRQKYSDQSLENLDDQHMIKLMEALTAGSSILSNDEQDEQEGEEEDEDGDDCCCHSGCCK